MPHGGHDRLVSRGGAHLGLPPRERGGTTALRVAWLHSDQRDATGPGLRGWRPRHMWWAPRAEKWGGDLPPERGQRDIRGAAGTHPGRKVRSDAGRVPRLSTALAGFAPQIARFCDVGRAGSQLRREARDCPSGGSWPGSQPCRSYRWGPDSRKLVGTSQGQRDLPGGRGRRREWRRSCLQAGRREDYIRAPAPVASIGETRFRVLQGTIGEGGGGAHSVRGAQIEAPSISGLGPARSHEGRSTAVRAGGAKSTRGLAATGQGPRGTPTLGGSVTRCARMRALSTVCPARGSHSGTQERIPPRRGVVRMSTVAGRDGLRLFRADIVSPAGKKLD
jgi:hypothetical protein